ncbi:MAG: amidohydrolase family protein [Acidimicrobiia bacterium]
MTFDVHAHCIPPGLIDTLRRDGDRYDIEIVDDESGPSALIAGRVKAGPLRADLQDVEARLATMERTGVGTQLVSSWIDLTAYALSAAAGSRYARRFNESLADLVAHHPDRLEGLCTVPLQAPQAAASELRHAVTELGMVGVEIATTVDGVELDAAELDPFWGAAEELRCLVLLHPLASLSGRELGRYFLGNIVGNPAETTIALAHLVFGGVLERFPELRVCAVHGGGFAPYQAGRWHRGFEAVSGQTAGNLTHSPREWLRGLYFDTVLHSPPALSFLIDLVGADHVVLGSDYPFEMGDPDPVATVESVPGLGPEQRDLILEGNVRRLLGEVRR